MEVVVAALVRGVEPHALHAGDASGEHLEQRHQLTVATERSAAPEARADLDRHARPRAPRLGDRGGEAGICGDEHVCDLLARVGPGADRCGDRDQVRPRRELEDAGRGAHDLARRRGEAVAVESERPAGRRIGIGRDRAAPFDARDQDRRWLAVLFGERGLVGREQRLADRAEQGMLGGL